VVLWVIGLIRGCGWIEFGWMEWSDSVNGMRWLTNASDMVVMYVRFDVLDSFSGVRRK
jgi:hypothetical protein